MNNEETMFAKTLTRENKMKTLTTHPQAGLFFKVSEIEKPNYFLTQDKDHHNKKMLHPL